MLFRSMEAGISNGKGMTDFDYYSCLLIPVESALLNIRAVQEVLDSQSLQYIFPYSSFSFDTDLNFILLAEGRKSTFFQVRPLGGLW